MGVSIEQNNWDSSPGQWPFSRLRSPADPGIPAELQDHPIFFLGSSFWGVIHVCILYTLWLFNIAMV